MIFLKMVPNALVVSLITQARIFLIVLHPFLVMVVCSNASSFVLGDCPCEGVLLLFQTMRIVKLIVLL